MLATLKEISTPSPKARIGSVDEAEGEGEEEPLMGRASGVYGSGEDGTDGVRRRVSRGEGEEGSSRGSSASSGGREREERELAQTGSVDARGLVEDVKIAVGVEETGTETETEDEMDEHGAALVKKPE